MGSQEIDGIRIASPEHLLVLKLEALKDRKGSGKGEKDAADVYRILLSMEGRKVVGKRLAHMTQEQRAALAAVRRSPAALSLTGGNQHEASVLNKRVDRVLSEVDNALSPTPEVTARKDTGHGR